MGSAHLNCVYIYEIANFHHEVCLFAELNLDFNCTEALINAVLVLLTRDIHGITVMKPVPLNFLPWGKCSQFSAGHMKAGSRWAAGTPHKHRTAVAHTTQVIICRILLTLLSASSSYIWSTVLQPSKWTTLTDSHYAKLFEKALRVNYHPERLQTVFWNGNED